MAISIKQKDGLRNIMLGAPERVHPTTMRSLKRRGLTNGFLLTVEGHKALGNVTVADSDRQRVRKLQDDILEILRRNNVNLDQRLSSSMPDHIHARDLEHTIFPEFSQELQGVRWVISERFQANA